MARDITAHGRLNGVGAKYNHKDHHRKNNKGTPMGTFFFKVEKHRTSSKWRNTGHLQSGETSDIFQSGETPDIFKVEKHRTSSKWRNTGHLQSEETPDIFKVEKHRTSSKWRNTGHLQSGETPDIFKVEKHRTSP